MKAKITRFLKPTLRFKTNHGRQLLMLFVLSTLPATALAQFTYETNNGAITVTGYAGPAGAVIVPDRIDGMPVTAIGGHWSSGLGFRTITSVVLPNTVTNIGRDAFSFCASLTNATLSKGLATIEAWAFAYCTTLTDVAVPANSIGEFAFFDCISLNSVALGNNLISIEQNAFRGCRRLTNIALPQTLRSIGEDAFNECTSLADLRIPNTVTNIGYAAFELCSGLTSLVLPDSLTAITACSFAYSGLTNVTIPSSVTTIETEAFCGCPLTGITIPNSVTNIGTYSFGSCTNLVSVTIPSSVIWVHSAAFMRCTNLVAAYFRGNAPVRDLDIFLYAPTTVYYLPGTKGWSAEFSGRPSAPWVLPNPVILTTRPSFGPKTNAFNFVISWATNASVVVEASPTLGNPVWSPVSTNTLSAGSSYFSDPDWAKYSGRLYRLRWP